MQNYVLNRYGLVKLACGRWRNQLLERLRRFFRALVFVGKLRRHDFVRLLEWRLKLYGLGHARFNDALDPLD